MYGFNPLSLLDLIALPVKFHFDLDGKKRAELVQQLHERARANVE